MSTRVKLDNPPLGELKNRTYALATRQIEEMVEESGCTAALSDALYATMVADATAFRIAEAIDRYGRVGSAKSAADKERDDITVAFKKQLQVYVTMKGERAQAAKELLDILNRINADIRLSHAEQTAQLHKVIDELSTPRSKGLIEFLAVEDIVEALKSAHLAFSELMKTKASKESSIKESRLLEEKRAKSNISFRDFLRNLHSHRNLPEWRDLYLTCEDYINDLFSSARIIRSNARKKSDSTDDKK